LKSTRTPSLASMTSSLALTVPPLAAVILEPQP
jgi:hypothetical protein